MGTAHRHAPPLGAGPHDGGRCPPDVDSLPRGSGRHPDRVHALRFEDSFVKAFEQAKQRIAERERAEKREPSNPQIFVGDEMAAKLPKLEAELRARRSGGSI